MKKFSSTLFCALVATLVALSAAAAQSAAQFGDPEAPASGGILLALASPEVYVLASGGVGDEERARMASEVSRYSVRMTFSEQNGQYVVPDTLSVTKNGAEVLHMNNAGPLVYAQMPPGQYAFHATYTGVTQNRVLNVSGGSASLAMTWPTALD
jgi:hypothetical protein